MHLTLISKSHLVRPVILLHTLSTSRANRRDLIHEHSARTFFKPLNGHVSCARRPPPASRSTVDRLSPDCCPTVARLSPDCCPTVARCGRTHPAGI
ncbi:unnamed protein product [Arctia plantaginis]|uniref:Uncharacterized protein n=1 Tax=Arctia plantaginis TaxID=874455 RepID=A0A8S0ZCV9_ARCPL|nr:unnamed protein product [Arctia plantaginis]